MITGSLPIVVVHHHRRVLDPQQHGALRRRVLHLVLELARVVGAVLRHELPALDPVRPDELEGGDDPEGEPLLQLLLLVAHLVHVGVGRHDLPAVLLPGDARRRLALSHAAHLEVLLAGPLDDGRLQAGHDLWRLEHVQVGRTDGAL